MPRFIKPLFSDSDELVEVPSEGSGIIYRSSIPNEARDEAFASFGLNGGKTWVSRAVAVHPSDVASANAELERNGISGEYKSDGKFYTNSKRARNDLFKLKGYFDKDAGYSDYAG